MTQFQGNLCFQTPNPITLLQQRHYPKTQFESEAQSTNATAIAATLFCLGVASHCSAPPHCNRPTMCCYWQHRIERETWCLDCFVWELFKVALSWVHSY